MQVTNSTAHKAVCTKAEKTHNLVLTAPKFILPTSAAQPWYPAYHLHQISSGQGTSNPKYSKLSSWSSPQTCTLPATVLPLSVKSNSTPPVASAKKLGLIHNSAFSYIPHLSQQLSEHFARISKHQQSDNFLPPLLLRQTTISSCLDYWNSLLTGLSISSVALF